MAGIEESGVVRLKRLAAQCRRSRQAADDDAEAFHTEIEAMRAAGHSYEWIAACVEMSKTQTFRLANRLSGPRTES